MLTQLAQEIAQRQETGTSQKRFAAFLSIAVNLFLIGVEGAIAVFTGSLTVLADAGHSVFDLTASFFALWGVRMASQPPDQAHPYGHEKFENVSSLIQVAIIGLIAVFIAVQVGIRLNTGFTLHVSNLAIGVLASTMVVDFLAARYIGSVAQAHGSYALEADAFHFTTDLWSKVAAMMGLVAARLGAELVDPAAALTVAVIMIYTASRLGLRTTHVLLDAAPHSSLQQRIHEILIREAGPGGYHSLRMRQAGKRVFLDVALHLPGNTPLAEAHQRAHRLAQHLRNEIPEVRDAVVHVEPEDHPQEHLNDHFQLD